MKFSRDVVLPNVRDAAVERMSRKSLRTFERSIRLYYFIIVVGDKVFMFSGLRDANKYAAPRNRCVDFENALACIIDTS